MAFATLALVAPRPARANGAFPDEFSLHFPANAPHRIFMGANFGLLVSEDDGLTWRYSCEPWVVAGSNAALAYANVNFYQVTADGALLAAAINLTRSSDVGCSWPISTGSIAGQLVADFFPAPTDATFVLANILTSSASYIVASHDGGKTFDSKHLYDTPDQLTGVEIARAKPSAVYATSVSGSAAKATFLASADSGATWIETVLPFPAGTQPRILAVDPVDEKTVYLRLLNGPSDAVVVTPDAGKTFQPLLTVNGQLSSFLRAGDGTLYAGQVEGTLYVRPPGATTFVKQPAPRLRCLGQRPGSSRIYACGDTYLDNFSIGSSDDGGKTFQPVMKFTDLRGPLTCPSVQTACAAHWERIQGVLGIAPDAGSPGGPPDAGTPAPPRGSSHCASLGAGVWSLLGLLAVALRRGKS